MELEEEVREIRADGFKMKRLRAHSILDGIPLRTLSRIELRGGPNGMTIGEISSIVGFSGEMEVEVGPLTRMLFWLRSVIGRILKWDDATALVDSVSFVTRLTAEDRARSVIQPGTPQGISRVLFCFESEYLAEIINRTVHCFWHLVSERTSTGYAVYCATYVRKLNWFTPIYMAMITPFLKWIIYPSIEEGIRRRWAAAFPQPTSPRSQSGSKAVELPRN